MNKLKYLLFLMIIFVSPVVFALDYDVTSQITSPVAPSGVGTYTGEENNGATYSYNIRTTYDGTLQAIRFNLPVPSNFVDGTCFSNNIEYKVTMYMADNDWRNRFGSVFVGYSSSSNENFSNGNVTFVSMRQIYFTFKIPSGNTYCHNSVYVNLRSSDLFIPFTGDTNWNLSSVILTDSTTSSGGSSGSGSTNQDIIDNQTNNTNNIITNNNQNTTNIIDNNNQNTQSVIDNNNQNLQSSMDNFNDNFNKSLMNCNNSYNFTLKKGYKYSTSGSVSADNNYYYTDDYIRIGNVDKLTITVSPSLYSGDNYGNIILYNSNKQFVDYFSLYNRTITLSEGSYYFRFSSSINNVQIFQGTGCSSKLDDLKEQQNQNTQDIIDNQNSNTQQQIESQKVCQIVKYDNSVNKSSGYLDVNSNVINTVNWYRTSDFIPVVSGKSYNIIINYDAYSPSYCLYYESKTLIGCYRYANQRNILITPSVNGYIRYSLLVTGNNTTFFQYEDCKNGNQAIQDSLTDSNVDSDTGTGFFDNFTDEDFGLSQIITIPLNTIQSLTSKTCSPLQIPIPFTNSNVTLPCMTELYETKFPTIYNLWKIVSFGIIAYLISIDIFHIVKGFKDPESDKVEVLDL